MNDQTKKTIGGVVGCGISGISWLLYAGPYKWMVDIQTETIGAYYPVLSFLIPALAIGFVVERLLNHFCSNDEVEEGESFFGAMSSQSRLFYRMAGGAAGLLFVALWMLIPTMSVNDEIEKVSVRSLEQGESTETSWVSTSGKLLWDDCGVEEDLSETFMIPIVSKAWQAGRPVAVFVKMSGHEAAEFGEDDFGKFEGMLATGGMSSDWIEFFNDHTGIKIADNHIMINYGDTPDFNRNCGIVCLTGSWLLGMISIFSFNSNGVQVPPSTATTPQYTIGETTSANQMQPNVPDPLESPDVAAAVSHSVDDDVKNWMASRGIDS